MGFRNRETKISRNGGASGARWVLSLLAPLLAFWHPTQNVRAHIVPPENLHPIAEIYRRAVFTLNLNPVPWDQIRADVVAFGSYWKSVDSTQSEQFSRKAEAILARASVNPEEQNGVEFLPRKEAALVSKALINMLEPYKDFVCTLTGDNGKEFSEHQRIADALNADFYFANPYCSWERGLNENTNGLIRQYFPKKTCLLNVDINHIKEVQDKLNNRPRKLLIYQKPAQLFLNPCVALGT